MLVSHYNICFDLILMLLELQLILFFSEIVVAPPSIYLEYTKSIVPVSIGVSAQNCYKVAKGAFTGTSYLSFIWCNDLLTLIIIFFRWNQPRYDQRYWCWLGYYWSFGKEERFWRTRQRKNELNVLSDPPKPLF